MNKAVSARRLLKLAIFLEALPRKRFDYSHWVGDDWQGARDLSCGTTGCALGWAATMPEFRRLGLRLMCRKRWNGGLHGYADLEALGPLDARGSTTDRSLIAAASVFGLLATEARYVFLPEHSDCGGNLPDAPTGRATPKQVAAHIRRFVKARRS